MRWLGQIPRAGRVAVNPMLAGVKIHQNPEDIIARIESVGLNIDDEAFACSLLLGLLWVYEVKGQPSTSTKR